MKKAFNFLLGLACGAATGAAAILLFAPASGSQLREEAKNHWENALNEARLAMDETNQRLTVEFESMKQGTHPTQQSQP